MNGATVTFNAEDERSFLKSLAENWPVLSGFALAFITIGILWTRVEVHGEALKEDKAEQQKISDEVHRVATDVAVVRAILEERAKK